MKHKCPAELNTRVTRILLSDYLVLMALSRRTGDTMAVTLHNILTRLGPAKPKGEPARIPVTDFRVTAPVALRYEPQLTRQYEPGLAMATNGKATAFRIKQKGVKYD
ncbi:hypothetical protein ES705_38645 [subsurface metagenome]